MVRIAYQGEPGAYTEQAALQFFQAEAKQKDLLPCSSFKAVFERLMCDEADRAVLPIENMLAGTIHQNLDLLLKHEKIHIVGELDFQVRHCLLAQKGTKISDISVVRSHYMALDQCKHFLDEHNLVPEVAYDTAGSAKRIHEEKLENCAAIASRGAAELYGLQILAEEIGDIGANFTRFLVLSKNPEEVDPEVPAKTSIAFAFDNHAGKLYQAIGCLALNNIDLTKIESRHIYTLEDTVAKDRKTALRWAYIFYIDLAGSRSEMSVDLALKNLELKTDFFRVLGSYKRHELSTCGK